VPGTAAAGRICALVRGLCADAVAAGCEGLMAKSLDGPTSLYAPALRSETSWIKLKRDYLRQEGMGDTLDVVPIAAWRGSGRKAVSRTVAPLD
jgi:ATP-dependent DNA ligase